MALAPQQFCVRWNSYHTNLQTVFPKLLSTENFADVTLACESKQLRCHKVVLSACSAYFERLLVQNPCKHPIIFMKDMRFSEMQALVDFMYKGEVNVTQDELPSLLKSAEALQIRGLCSSDAGTSCESETKTSGPASTQTADYTLATQALLAHVQLDCQPTGGSDNNGQTNTAERTNGPATNSKSSKPRTPSSDLKEERVEEDGLYYGEMDGQPMDFHDDEESGKPGSSMGQSSASQPAIRVKPESKLLKNQSTDYLTRLSQMNPFELQSELYKYGFTADTSPDDDYYKSWLEKNGELEVSLLRNGKRGDSEQNKSLLEKSLMKNETHHVTLEPAKKAKRGRPSLKDRPAANNMLKADLDQFLEGKEVSSSGISRSDLERVMMGKFNPNRRYSNEAMWAALMDVKRGGSIYRAAQTHKVPRKSLRNWMKRCHIKSSFPMPQQLKQFVENNRRHRHGSGSPLTHEVSAMNIPHGSNVVQGANTVQAENVPYWLQNTVNVVETDAAREPRDLSQGSDVMKKQAHFEQEMVFGSHFLAMANEESSDDSRSERLAEPEKNVDAISSKE